MNSDFNGNSRYSYRSKRKKTNLILNGAIVIVLLLIGIVAYSIFFLGNDKASSKQEAQATVKNQSVDKIKKGTSSHSAASDKTTTDKSSTNGQTAAQDNSSGTSSVQNNSGNTAADSGQGTASSQNVQNVQVPGSTNSSGTSQTGGQHVTSYDSSSADWQEMLQTISSATGINQSNMTVWFLGSDKTNPGGSVGTVSSKDKTNQKYRVYLQWDGQGYKATKVEQVSQ